MLMEQSAYASRISLAILKEVDQEQSRHEQKGNDEPREKVSETLVLDVERGSGSDDDSEDTSTAAGDDEDLKEQERQTMFLVKNETKAVRYLRFMTLLLLLTVTTAVAAVVYLYTHNQQVKEFHDTFGDYAQQIVDAVQANAQHKLEAISALALELQAYAINTPNVSWPFVTMPFFEEHIAATKSLTNAYGVMLIPIVTRAQREEWEAYAIANRGWINASYAAQRKLYGEDGLGIDYDTFGGTSEDWFDVLWGEDYIWPGRQPDFSYGFASKISTSYHPTLNNEVRPIVDGDHEYYFPQWQSAPLNWYYQSAINWNYGMWEDFAQQTQIVNETHAAVYGMPWTDEVTPGYVSTMLYPIFDAFYDEDGKNRSVVAMLSIDIFWETFLEDILPPNMDGINVVIDTPCGESFTFALKGNDAVFLGDGDVHEAQFDSMAMTTRFGKELIRNGTAVVNDDYKGSPLAGTLCPYIFNVYPTLQMEQHYVNNDPVIYTIVAVAIFVFTALVFLAYDLIVERRQRKVMNAVKRSDAVVSSLFPSEVKSQLYKESDAKQTRKGQKQVVDEFMRNPTMNDDDGPSPIANLYTATTIMFGDLVGFTAWSSGRQPKEVFLLLESIYAEFDKVAKRRNVFKVETIGDCYVAVTGIPRPQADHAVIMAKFAQDCQRRLREVVTDLAEKLGSDTLELAMRIGLHSGPVTAGVLRGDKARFQLFGDTMNTAARMEHNGMPHRIQVSEDTADLLRQAGKAHWLRPRSDKINAKGKGEMQTYWVSSRSDKGVATMSSLSHTDDSTSRQSDPKVIRSKSADDSVSADDPIGAVIAPSGHEDTPREEGSHNEESTTAVEEEEESGNEDMDLERRLKQKLFM